MVFLKKKMCRPQVVRSGFRSRKGFGEHKPPEGDRAPSGSDRRGQRTYPGPAGRGGGGHPPQHMEPKAARPPSAPRWAWRGCRGAGASSPRPGARGPRPQAPGTQHPAVSAGGFRGSQAAEAAGRDRRSAGSAGGQGTPRPGGGGSGGKSELGPLRGRSGARNRDSPCLRP